MSFTKKDAVRYAQVSLELRTPSVTSSIYVERDAAERRRSRLVKEARALEKKARAKNLSDMVLIVNRKLGVRT